MPEVTQLLEMIQAGDEKAARELTMAALEQGFPPETILDQGLIAAMDIVGELFRNGEIFMPEMLVAANAMKSALAVLRPQLVKTGVKSVGKAIIGTVEGDMHDIGKNMLGMMLEGAGFEITDLGMDVSAEKIVAAVQQEDNHIVGLSALLSTTMPEMANVIEKLKQAGIREEIRVLIGGAPVTQEFADLIGADGYADDVATGAQMARRMVTHR